MKESPDGSVNKLRDCLVAKGSHQKPGFDYNETFCPMIKHVTIWVILTLALTHKWIIWQIDVNNSFLNGHLLEEVYMTQPLGFEAVDKSLICLLHYALYGLK